MPTKKRPSIRRAAKIDALIVKIRAFLEVQVENPDDKSGYAPTTNEELWAMRDFVLAMAALKYEAGYQNGHPVECVVSAVDRYEPFNYYPVLHSRLTTVEDDLACGESGRDTDRIFNLRLATASIAQHQIQQGIRARQEKEEQARRESRIRAGAVDRRKIEAIGFGRLNQHDKQRLIELLQTPAPPPEPA